MRSGLKVISSIKFNSALKHLDLIKEFLNNALSEDREGNPNTFKDRIKSHKGIQFRIDKIFKWAIHKRDNCFNIFKAYMV